MATEIERLSRSGVNMLLDWAAAEGWNPGLDDAAPFQAADPEGFLILRVDGQPAAAVSVVRHDADIAFLGLFICAPEFRGRGLGARVFAAGLSHAEGRSVGLDAVPAQVDRYAAMGFAASFSSRRWSGDVPQEWAARRSRSPDPAELMAMTTADQRAEGYRRDAFLSAYWTDAPGRRTLILSDRSGEVQGWATVRRCRDGLKIGPLNARTPDDARSLIGDCAMALGASRVAIDIPSDAEPLWRMLERADFSPEFATTRMWKGTAPSRIPRFLNATATLELG